MFACLRIGHSHAFPDGFSLCSSKFTSSTAPRKAVVVNHGWESDSLMDRKVVGVVFFGVVALVAMVAVVTSPTTAACSVV